MYGADILKTSFIHEIMPEVPDFIDFLCFTSLKTLIFRL